MLLSCLADLKSAKPSICAESRSCLVNNRPASMICALLFVRISLASSDYNINGAGKGRLENIDITS